MRRVPKKAVYSYDDPASKEEYKQRRNRVLTRLLGMVKPWKHWVILSNTCIILSSFLGVFSLVVFLPFLSIIFGAHSDAEKLLKHKAAKAHPAAHATTPVANAATTATLTTHTLAVAEPTPEASAPARGIASLENLLKEEEATSTSVVAKVNGVVHSVRDIRRRMETAFTERAKTDPFGTVYIICVVFAVATLVKVLLDYSSALFINRVQTQFLKKLTNDLYSHCLTHDLAFFGWNPVGRLLNYVYNDTLKLRTLLQLFYGTRIRQPITLVWLTILMFSIEARMATIILVSVPVLLLPTLLISRAIRNISRAEAGVDSNVMEVMEEQLGGVRLIKSFGAEQQELKRYARVADGMFMRRWKRGVLQGLNEPVMDFLICLGLIAIILFGLKAVLGWQLIQGKTYLFFIIVLSRFYAPLKSLTAINVELQRPLMSAEVIFRILDTPPKIIDRPSARPVPRPWHSIEFRDVWFRYTKKSRNALANINLMLRGGESVAILGHNGSGKTTLSALMSRLYDPTLGTILLDGVDLREYQQQSLRRMMGSVGQHAMLFNMSVTRNIAFGIEEKDIDMERVRWAAAKTGADAFVQNLPEGYDTLVGRHGGSLSGGQRQLLTLARVYYHNFGLIVYDEPTTHLDVEAGDVVMRIMRELKHEHTVILITHDVRHVMDFDRVILMQAGQIVQDTTPDKIDMNLLYRLQEDPPESTRVLIPQT